MNMRSLGIATTCMVFVFFSGCEAEKLSYGERLARDLQIIDEYLDENSITAEIDPSGLRYVIVDQGTGAVPTLQNEVTATYSGRLMDTGVLFEDRLDESVSFPLFGLIECWKIGIPKIRAGGSIILYAPSVLSYGRSGSPTGNIPPDANLIFEINLISVP